MSSVSTQKINTQSPLFTQVFALREKVLRQPLGLSLYNEDTSGDAVDVTFIAIANEIIIGCVMCKLLGDGIVKLRQMAVEDKWQNQGIGKLLVLAAEADARQNNQIKIQLHARQNAIGFYEKLGFNSYGSTFTEVGLPHMAMEKLL